MENRDMKWANTVWKMVTLIDLFDSVLPQTFDLLKKNTHKTHTVFVKHSKTRCYEMQYAYKVQLNSFYRHI